jgi:hypothetical protein
MFSVSAVLIFVHIAHAIVKGISVLSPNIFGGYAQKTDCQSLGELVGLFGWELVLAFRPRHDQFH